MSVPESVCFVDDKKSNFSQSCNNDNYDSNQSKTWEAEKLSMQ